MQRLHQDDLVGHVLLQDDWTVLSFPAIAEEPEIAPFDTPYGPRLFVREPGEALHPEARRSGRLNHTGVGPSARARCRSELHEGLGRAE